MQSDTDENEAVVQSADAPLTIHHEPLPPVLPIPNTLIRVFRLLQDRIPGFTQLSIDEERSMIRASHLDPEFISDSLLAAEVWDKTEFFAKMTSQQMHQLDAEIREWDSLEKELTVLLKGISGANRKRRHRLGTAILGLYFGLRLQANDPANNHLRPYFERMKRSYMKNRKTREKAKKGRDAAQEAEVKVSDQT